MEKKKFIALLLAAIMMVSLFAGCGGSAASAVSEAEVTASSAEAPAPEEAPEAPAEEAPAAPVEAESAMEASAVEEEAPVEEAADGDFTAANAAMDFSGYKEMLKNLTTELPITEEPVTLTYFFGFEGSTLNYIPSGTMDGHQVWTWLREHTGVNVELTVVDKTQETDQFNLMIASGDFADLFPAGDYTAGIETAFEEEIVISLDEYLEENMPNYWTIVHSDQKLLGEVMDGDHFLALYALKDQVANPSSQGAFIRMDWLEDLGMDVPQTYDELTDVLRAFKSEKGATEALSVYNTVNFNSGVLSGGFGSMAELSTNGMGSNALNGYYQVDGQVVYGATAEGTRKYLSWLNLLYEEDLIDFENMQNREMNPFSEYNAGQASSGATGYIVNNQPFGGIYSQQAAANGDENCNWWPVQDVAEEAGATIPFFEEVSLIDMTSLAISSQCEAVEVALQFLDYGYSYEGSLLYNFGFQKGSGHDVETWDFDADGEPLMDGDALLTVAEATNIASGVISTKDLAGVVFDKRLSFEFGERELACFDAWSTNKTNENILGSATTLNAEEGTEASAIYSDILTYVATSSLQFINGTLDIDNDADWDNYVSTIESMNIDGLTDIIQGAYDRANG